MSRYKVTQQFMDALTKWRDDHGLKPTTNAPRSYLELNDLRKLPRVVDKWRHNNFENPIERNKRLISIIQWVNGDDVFEVKKPHEFIVRSTKADVDGDYRYLAIQDGGWGVIVPKYGVTDVFLAEWFATRVDAEIWTTNGYEVVEIDGGGNEVGADEKFDFVVFGPTFNLKNNLTGTINMIIYQKTIDEVSEMLGKPAIDKERGSGMVVQTFMLKSDYEATNKHEKRW